MKNRAIRPCTGANAAACGLFCAQNWFFARFSQRDRSTHSKRSHTYVPAKEGLKEPNSDAAVCQRCGRIIIPAAGLDQQRSSPRKKSGLVGIATGGKEPNYVLPRRRKSLHAATTTCSTCSRKRPCRHTCSRMRPRQHPADGKEDSGRIRRKRKEEDS